MNNDFHQFQNYQKINEYQFINYMFFGAKKTEITKVEDTSSKDLAIVTQMNQEFAKSLDLKETLQNSLDVIIKRINAQAANIFLIDDKKISEVIILDRTKTNAGSHDGIKGFFKLVKELKKKKFVFKKNKFLLFKC